MAPYKQERNERIAELWETGKSAMEIAVELKLTRNTVIGAISRMRTKGMITRPFAHHQVRERPGRRRPPPVDPSTSPREPSKPLPLLAPVILPRIKEPPPEPYTGGEKTLLDLGPRDCRFVTRTRPAFFCGAPVHKRSLCAEHFALCWHPPAPPRRLTVNYDPNAAYRKAIAVSHAKAARA